MPTTWSNQTKNTASYSNQSKNTATWTFSTRTLVDDYLLKEDGSYLLLENGDQIILEQSVTSAYPSSYSFQTKN